MSEPRVNSANIGFNLSSTASQRKEGELSFALNAVVEGIDGESVSYQNEPANTSCLDFPEGYKVVGARFITEKGYSVFFLSDGQGNSEIGTAKDCIYTKVINTPCLNFNINSPIHRIVTKITNCTTELYWANKGMRYIDLDNLPYKESKSEFNCDVIISSTEVDCNKLNVQPNFAIPSIRYIEVGSDGDLVAGTYQFGIQYATSQGDPYTAVYAITQPISVNDFNKVTQDFNYHTSKSITFSIEDIDITGVYDYINIIVVKTINNISSVELVDTRRIVDDKLTITYTGASKVDERLSANDLFETFAAYSEVDSVFTVSDVLGWSGLTVPERVSYQNIANKISLQWQSWRLRDRDNYSLPMNTAEVKGYMRDETYMFSLILINKQGRESDAFPIPGRKATLSDLETVSGTDVPTGTDGCNTDEGSLPSWKVYNTATKNGYSSEYLAATDLECYSGPYEYGEFAYTESTDIYPCDNEIYGENAGQAIRGHKFPDNSISHIHDGEGNIYPIGVKIDIDQIRSLIIDSGLTQEQKDEIIGFKIVRGNRANNKSIIAKGLLYNVGKYTKEERDYFYINYPFNDLRKDPLISISLTGDDSGSNSTLMLDGFSSEDSRKRFTFHSPDTHFYQPFLGNQLRLETIEYGQADGHYIQVKKHARYKLLSSGSYITSLGVSMLVGFASASAGLGSTNVFNGTAAFMAFSALISIIDKTIPKINPAYQFNSVGRYTHFIPIPNAGDKVRAIDLSSYLVSGMTSAGDILPINNYLRESSVYLRTTRSIPFPHEAGAPEDRSRWVLSDDNGCDGPFRRVRDISSYYASIKRNILNQWGTINSYELVDTGFSHPIDLVGNTFYGTSTIFGGDIFINRFALKRKHPFFIDHRVGVQDESDIFFEELGNVGYPTYWMSTDVVADIKEADPSTIQIATGLLGGLAGGLLGGGAKKIEGSFKKFFGVKSNNFDCKTDKFLYQNGKFYLFAYGIPYFYCESEVNVDYRQAFNYKEGDFFPRVGDDIPDEWLQEINTTIQQDNTYFYNKGFSKQNKERHFTRLPLEYKERCEREYPNTAIYSDVQSDLLNYKKNSWLTYRPVSMFNFPINYGKLISIEGIEDRAILARFENKSLIYNALITVDTSTPKAIYLGNDKLFKSSPPIDFAETDTGYNGTQHKFFLKTKKGNVSVDALRGEVIVMNGRQATELSGEQFRVGHFLKEHLPFKINKYFPDINIDNHFNGVGLHGVYDGRFGRFILTKLDYIPLNDDIIFNDGKFYLDDDEIFLQDNTLFCNQSFTLSFDFDSSRWISFHSYSPLFYVGESNVFYSGIEGEGLWMHHKDYTKYNSFYGIISPYILEYPFIYKMEDEIIQGVADNTRVYKQINATSRVVVGDKYFNKVILYNDQQCSGVRELVPKTNNLSTYLQYPKFTEDSIQILVDKRDSLYTYNTFWDVVRDSGEPIFIEDCSIYDKKINAENMDYTSRSFKKYPIRGHECYIRHILDNSSDYRLISKFLLTITQPSR